MDTVRLTNKRSCRMIAHRGLAALERENTAAAFLAAANRSYYGIETDVHVTRDGKFVVVHDSDLMRVAGVPLSVEGSTLAELQSVPLLPPDGTAQRRDLVVPTLADYISICHRYDKEAVLELKTPLTPAELSGILSEIAAHSHLERTTFISFHPQNLTELRRQLPTARAQFLPSEGQSREWILSFAAEGRFDLDIYYPAVTPEVVAAAHAAGLAVNCWTVNDAAAAERLLAMGVDFMTTEVLE